MPNIKKIVELSFFIIVNIFISVFPLLDCINRASDWVIIDSHHLNPATVDIFPFIICFILLWIPCILFKSCLFPFLFRLQKYLPNIHNFFVKLTQQRSFKYKFTIIILLMDALLNGIITYLLFNDSNSRDIIDSIVLNFLFGGGVWFCYLSLYIWLDTKKNYFTKQP